MKYPRHATNRHHIVPSSRAREMGIDPDFDGNVKVVNMTKHQAFHVLFGNRLIEECIELLENEWSLDKDGELAFQNELKRRGLK